MKQSLLFSLSLSSPSSFPTFFLSFSFAHQDPSCTLCPSPFLRISNENKQINWKKKKTGEGPLCYDFSKLDRYLAQPEVRKGLNVDPDAPWQECNMDVNHDMLVDFMRSYSDRITPLLDGEGEEKKGKARVLIYVGVEDFIW